MVLQVRKRKKKIHSKMKIWRWVSSTSVFSPFIDSVKINVFSLFSLGRGFFAGGLYFADCMLKGTHQGKVAVASLIVFMRATFTN